MFLPSVAFMVDSIDGTGTNKIEKISERPLSPPVVGGGNPIPPVKVYGFPHKQ